MIELYLISECGYNNGLMEGFVLGITFTILALVIIEINNIIKDGNTSDRKEIKKD
jgi:hypothetical protein